jgi:hypothetical protein
MSFEIIDNIVDLDIQNEIESALLGSEANWRFSRSSAYNPKLYPDVSDEQRRQITQFNHIVFDGQIRNPNYDLYTRVAHAVADKKNQKILAITNMRAHLQLPIHNKPIGIPHVDKHDPNPFSVIVYYVNDTDGDTVLYNQDKTELVRISPKKGRCVVFDGNIYHRAGMPTIDIRCIINYNLYTKERT